MLRILQAKERLGLHQQRLVDPAALPRSVGRPEDVEQALDVARRSITVVRNEGGVLPLQRRGAAALLHLVMSSDARNGAIGRASRRPSWPTGASPRRRMFLGPRSRRSARATSWPGAGTSRTSWRPRFVRVAGFRGTADMSESHARAAARARPRAGR